MCEMNAAVLCYQRSRSGLWSRRLPAEAGGGRAGGLRIAKNFFAISTSFGGGARPPVVSQFGPDKLYQTILPTN